MTRLHLAGLLAWIVSVTAAMGIAWWGQRRNPAIEDDEPAFDDVDAAYRDNIRSLWHPDLEDKTWT